MVWLINAAQFPFEQNALLFGAAFPFSPTRWEANLPGICAE